MNPVAAKDIYPPAIGPGQRNAGADASICLIYPADIDMFRAGFQELGLKDSEIHKSYHFVDARLVAETTGMPF